MNLRFETDGVNISYNSKGKETIEEIATRKDTCRDMSNLFDYTNCNQKIWMDLYCKTGNMLQALKEKGVNKNNIVAICSNKQSQMLVCRKLYGKLLKEETVEIDKEEIKKCGYKITKRGNVYWIYSDFDVNPNKTNTSKPKHRWEDIVQCRYNHALYLIEVVIESMKKGMDETMSLEFTPEDNFQINNIIMNAPYNPDDLYIDFALLAKNIATDSVVAINPGKCQAKGGEKNEQFRKEIMPYISKLVYYPDTFEIFNVREQEGIIYYIFGKEEHKCKDIKVICNSCKSFDSNGIEHRDNIEQTLFGNKIAGILDKVTGDKLDRIIGVKQSEFVKNTDFGSASGTVPVYSGEKITGYRSIDELRTTDNLYKYKAVTSVMPVDVGFDKNGQVFGFSKVYNVPSGAVPKGSFPMLMSFNTSEECDSFISYCNTKLVRFLYYIGICGKTIAEEFWRFVPDPGAFDHTFKDEELYKKYNLTEEEITIIESVIKERN